MRIVAIRHLPTEWNFKGILQGSNDISIIEPTEELNKSIERNQAYLAEKYKAIDIVLASNLRRTQETAQLHGYDFIIEPLIREIHFEEYEGVPKSQMIEELGQSWHSNPYETKMVDEIRSMEQRMKEFIAKYDSYKAVLIFSHGAFMRGLYSLCNYGDLSKMNSIRISNNELLEFDF